MCYYCSISSLEHGQRDWHAVAQCFKFCQFSGRFKAGAPKSVGVYVCVCLTSHWHCSS